MTKLEELKVAYEAATPGEWTAPGFNSQGGKVACLLDNPDGLRLVSGNFKRPDATFIALSHNHMPTLLKAVEKLQWIAEFCAEHPEWFGGDNPDDGAENEWLHNTLQFLEKLK